VLSFGSTSVLSTTTTRYLHPNYEASNAPTSPISFEVPFAGTLRNMYARHNTTAGNGNAIVYTARVNGAATALAVSLASTTTSGNNVADDVVVAAGDHVDVEVTKAASIATSPSDILVTFELAPL
jgi:hypothetical protein